MPSRTRRAIALAAGLMTAGAAVVASPAAPVVAGRADRAAVDAAAANMSLVGFSDLGGGGLNGDIAVLGTTAIVGAGLVADPGATHTERFNPLECLPVSVKLVDVAEPTRPTVVSTIPLPPGVAAIEVAALRVSTPSFTGDLAAIALDDGPSHTTPTRCSPSQATVDRGVAYYDITDRARPALLGRYKADADRAPPEAPPCGVPPTGGTARCANGQHSVALVQRPDGRVLSISTEPVASLLSYPSGDVRVVDVTDPRNPVQLGAWAPLGQRPPSPSTNGCRSSSIGHDADFGPGGATVAVAYGDEGLITLDLTDPANPTKLGQFDYPEVRSVEGNASYVATTRLGGQTITLLADEDWHPPSTTLRIDAPSPLAGSKFACQATFTLFDPEGDAQIYRRPGSQIPGQIVYAGRGCSARPGVGGAVIPEDPYLTSVAGKIVLLDSAKINATQPAVNVAGCRHDGKVKRAQQAGALGVVLARVAGTTGFGAGGAATSIPGDPGAVQQEGVPLSIPLIQIDATDADPLRTSLFGGQVTSGAMVDGPGEWGGVHVVDTTNPRSPTDLGTYYTPTAKVFPPPDLGIYSVHHAVAYGNRALVAAYADGLRVLDLANPAAPTEVASFVPADVADPTRQLPAKAAVTGVAAMGGNILVSDINSGLYVLQLSGSGYWSAAADGGVFAFGTAPFLGSAGDLRLNSKVVGLAPTTSGRGYWLVAADGGIFSYGDAGFYGSTGDLRLNSPIVGMTPTPSGRGYWLVAGDGGVFSFGDAEFYGSTGNLRLNSPVVGMARTPTGRGYWLAAADGGIFTYGDAVFAGSTGDLRLSSRVVGVAAAPGGTGYWMVAGDGGVFAFGTAPFLGSTGDIRLNRPITGMAATSGARGYWMVATDGGVFAFGDAPFLGSTGGLRLNSPMVSLAPALP